MSDPIIADTKPVVMELEAGTYFWCSCGKSANQPFCDGAHKGTGLAPLKVELTEKKTVALCNCKQTQNKPFCDGAHTQLDKV